MFPELTSPTNQSSQAAHPGSVTFVNPDGSETVEPADALPDWVKFARGPLGRQTPVVLVARVRGGSGFLLRSYGTDGRLLAITASPAGTDVPAPEAISGWF